MVRVLITGIPAIVFVNVVAPYILACLLHRPKRLIIISSQLHRSARNVAVEDIFWRKRGERTFQDFQAYCDSKFHVRLIANAFARLWNGTWSVVSVHPGWVATKLGGAGAPDRLEDGVETYVMLAEGEYDQSITGAYFEPKRKRGSALLATQDVALQGKAIRACEEVTGLKMPA